MADEGFKRKLTTIFSADAAGYSRLMGIDKAATAKTITAYRNLMSDLITRHRGRGVARRQSVGRVFKCGGCGRLSIKRIT